MNTTTTSTGLDVLLFILEIFAFFYSVHYVLRYWKYFVGPNKIQDVFLRSVWESEIGFSLVFFTLIWVSANGLFGTDTSWIEWSAIIRKIILAMCIFYIIHVKMNLRDIWDFNKSVSNKDTR